MAHATHIHCENNHLVGIGSLRVLIREDSEGLWFARCIEIDYAACGDSLSDVQQRFESGLEKTIHAHLKRFNSINKLLKFAPESEWAHLLDDSNKYEFTLLTTHDVEELRQNLPFDKITYIQEKLAA